MMQLTKTHLRYLLAIYELAQTSPGVSAGAVAKVLAVSKPSVTRMMNLLMDRGLLVRERLPERLRLRLRKLKCLMPRAKR